MKFITFDVLIQLQWSIPSPIKNVMVVGIDTYHDPTMKGESIAGVVISLNQAFSRWHSQTMIQTPNTELVDSLKKALSEGLKAYQNCNSAWPETIMVRA